MLNVIMLSVVGPSSVSPGKLKWPILIFAWNTKSLP